MSEEEIQRKREAAKARTNERQHLRYHSDPEYREKIKQSNRDRNATAEYRKQQRERYANDPRFREQHAKYWVELKSMLKQNPKAYQLQRKQVSERVKAIWHGKVVSRWKTTLKARLKSPHYCDEVVWPLHKPVLYPVKTDHTCTTCGRKRYRGLKLWYVTRIVQIS